MMTKNVVLAVAFGLATLASSYTPLSAEGADQALLRAINGAKITLVQGIAQVAKGTEVPTEAKYEMEDGKLHLSVYTSAKGFDTAAEDNSFNEYGGEATAATWAPKKEVFADLKHIAAIGAVSHAAVDDQDDDTGHHPEGFAAGHGLFREGEGSQWQTCFRGDDRSGQYGQDYLLRPCDRRTRWRLMQSNGSDVLPLRSIRQVARRSDPSRQNIVEVLAKVAPMLSPLRTITVLTCALALLAGADRLVAQPADTSALQLEAKIPLGDVRGRIDHMAIDLARQHLFVAELENNSVGIVDLANRKVVRTIQGLREPQGVAFVPSMGALYVANAGDGSLRLFLAPEYTAMGQIELGDDADNIRVDSATNHLFVGYGSGGLAEIDTAYFKKGSDIPLGSHPEGFQLDPSSNQIFVNLPKAGAIAVVDRRSGKQTASWPMRIGTGNFSMALNQDAGHVLAAFRTPAKLGVFSMKDGALIASPDICGDTDDVFVDARSATMSMSSCGQRLLGSARRARGCIYQRIARPNGFWGAHFTLVPELDRFVACGAGSVRRTRCHLDFTVRF